MILGAYCINKVRKAEGKRGAKRALLYGQRRAFCTWVYDARGATLTFLELICNDNFIKWFYLLYHDIINSVVSIVGI